MTTIQVEHTGTYLKEKFNNFTRFVERTFVDADAQMIADLRVVNAQSDVLLIAGIQSELLPHRAAIFAHSVSDLLSGLDSKSVFRPVAEYFARKLPELSTEHAQKTWLYLQLFCELCE